MTLEATLEAVRAIEKAADSLMRHGDTPNAIALYALALKMRAQAGYWEEESEWLAVT